ncbi:YbjN domain-containing protein [Spirillospora sp. NPDC029432]|uniref:T3SS (YopN, CesT) and YbjN peptide-binding chaperone 1 n=1 Tax=Spirillospora sp. NPDC029432 TaxID=3154599 RepID=UPI00345661B2
MSREHTVAHVEKILATYLETDEVVFDEQGDVPIRRGSALYYVRVGRTEPYRVEVVSSVLSGVEETFELLKALNEINAGIYGIQAYYRGGRVIFSTDMLADTLQAEELERACALISGAADKYDDELQAKFGGKKTFEE